MRQGRPIGTRFREVALLAAPLAFSAFSLAFAALVEQLVLKRHSPAAAGASLTGGTLAGTFAVLITATASYATVFVAQFHGAGKGARAAAFFAQGVWIAALSLPLFAAAVPVGRFFLGHVGHAPELLAAETTFFSISVFGGFFTTLAAALSCLFLGQGRSMPVFLANFIGCLVQAALVPLAVFGGGPIPALGVAGAAGVRVISAVAVCLALVPFVARDGLLRGNFAALRPDFGLMRTMVGRGLPSGFKSFVGSLVFLGFVTVAGKMDVAALGIASVCLSVNNIVGTVVRAVASAVGILVGRTLGAGDARGARASVGRGPRADGPADGSLLSRGHSGELRSCADALRDLAAARNPRRNLSRVRCGPRRSGRHALHDGRGNRRRGVRLGAGRVPRPDVFAVGSRPLPDHAVLAGRRFGRFGRPLEKRTLAKERAGVIKWRGCRKVFRISR
jgi:Na+-driven multidrug efflux pump